MVKKTRAMANKGGCLVGAKGRKPKGGCKIGNKGVGKEEVKPKTRRSSDDIPLAELQRRKKAKAKKAEPKKIKFNVKPKKAEPKKIKFNVKPKKAKLKPKFTSQENIEMAERENADRRKKEKAKAPAKTKAKAKPKKKLTPVKRPSNFPSQTRYIQDYSGKDKYAEHLATYGGDKKHLNRDLYRHYADHRYNDAANTGIAGRFEDFIPHGTPDSYQKEIKAKKAARLAAVPDRFKPEKAKTTVKDSVFPKVNEYLRILSKIYSGGETESDTKRGIELQKKIGIRGGSDQHAQSLIDTLQSKSDLFDYFSKKKDNLRYTNSPKRYLDAVLTSFAYKEREAGTSAGAGIYEFK